MLGAMLLSALARRLGVPYPTFLALGGVGIAFLPDAPAWTLDPELALEDLLGVPPAEPGFPPFAAAERHRGDVRWLI